MKIPFGEWLPDLGDQNNPGATEAKNVLVSPDGYRPLMSLSISSDALDSTCIGAIAALANDGTIYNYAGSTNSLYELVSGVWTSRLNAYYTAVPSTLDLDGSIADYTAS